MFVKMSRKSYHDSVFTLPNRIVLDGDLQWRIPFNQILELTESRAPSRQVPAFIFHPAHCGSTLLSRALDVEGRTLAIRESFALRQFSASPQAQSTAEQNARQRGLNCLLDLLGRQYGENERVILKANVPVNYIIDEIGNCVKYTDQESSIKGIVLFNSLDDYLLAILKSEERKNWAVHVAKELKARIRKTPQLADINFETLDGAQAACVLWVSQMHEFTLAVEQNNGLLPLPSQDLYENPTESLQLACRTLELSISSSQINEIVAGALFQKHAKTPEREFSEATRQAERAQLLQAHRSEIDTVKDWMVKRKLSTDSSLSSAGH